MRSQENSIESVVHADDIKKQIENAENVDYKDKTIIGDLDLSLSKVPKIYVGSAELKQSSELRCKELGEKANFITSKIRITHCNIKGYINFGNTTFCDSVIFENCIFNNGVSFKCSRFRGPADFNRVEFIEDVDFDNVVFSGYIRFDRAKFNKKAKFGSVIFIARAYNPFGDNHVIFYESKFCGLANFENAEFWQYADFGYSNFISGALFRKARFYENANFEYAVIREHINFEEAAFGRYLCNIAEGAYFKGALFRGIINFQVSKFYNRAMFERSKFEGDANFIGANFYEHLIMSSAKIGRMHLRGANLGQKSLIILHDAEFERLLVRWDLIKNHLNQDYFNPNLNDDAVYLLLIKGFKELGLFEDADHCYYYYRSIKDNNRVSRHINKKYNKILNKLNLVKIIDPLACATCGYGTSLGYILISSTSIIISFGLLYWLRSNILIVKDCLINFNGSIIAWTLFLGNNLFNVSPNPEGRPLYFDFNLFNHIIFSVEVFLSQLPVDLSMGRVLMLLVMLERFIGWIFMALFILVATKKLIR